MTQGLAGLESRLADLAAASANFGFLLPHEPLLLFYGAAAQTGEFTDPSASMAAAHEFGEVFAVTLCRLFGVEMPAEDSRTHLHLLYNSGAPVSRPVLTALEELSAISYDGAGSHRGPAATHFVAQCFELAVWFFRFRTGDRDPVPFVRVEPAELHTLKERVAVMEKALLQLRRDFELRALGRPGPEGKRLHAGDAAVEPAGRSQAASAIEGLLTAAGWTVPEPNHDAKAHRSLGSVVVNPRSADGRRVDYLLLIGGRAAGLVVHFADGADPGAAMEQANRLAPTFSDVSSWPVGRSSLPYRYVSDGRRLYFRDENDLEPQARRVSGFHQPSTMARWLREWEADAKAPTYSARLALRLPTLTQPSEGSDVEPLRAPQRAAIEAIEKALSAGRRRALVQMVLGSGKTHTEILTAFRQLEYAKAHRILFVVDRMVLAAQLVDGFHRFSIPGQVRSFTELYGVQELTTATALTPSARIVVTTVRTLRSILSRSDTASDGVGYSSVLPPDAFDLIVLDDCRRSLYEVDRARLRYFDARLLGFTSMPNPSTIKFFEGGPVSEYTLEQAVADGSALDYSLYEARLDSPQRAALVPLDNGIAHRDRGTRRPGFIARHIVEPTALTAVLRAFKDSLAMLFPGRASHPGAVPKTLILAHDDDHAEQIVNAVSATFAEGPDFVRRINSRAAEPFRSLREFTTAPEFRIAVMRLSEATGFDVPALECMLILSDVRSEAQYAQLLARGTRQISAAALRAVSPGAIAKTHFVVIDAVGASRHHPRSLVNVTDATGAAGTIALSRLLDLAAHPGLRPDDRAELGLRLARLVPVLTDDEAATVRSLAGIRLEDLVRRLVETPGAGDPTGESLEAPDTNDVLSRLSALRETLLDVQGRLAGPDLRPSRRDTSAPKPSATSADRLAGLLEDWLGQLTPAQGWWIEHIADLATANSRFDPADLDDLPFSGRGGTDGFLREFGDARALGLLRELDRELA